MTIHEVNGVKVVARTRSQARQMAAEHALRQLARQLAK